MAFIRPTVGLELVTMVKLPTVLLIRIRSHLYLPSELAGLLIRITDVNTTIEAQLVNNKLDG